MHIVDASWHLPTTGRNGFEEYLERHIPAAVYFDIDHCATPGPLPHMLPAEEQFAQYAGSLGISEKDIIVVYDAVGLFSAARVWWMFRHFGAESVYVLEGGLPAWQRAGLPVESGECKRGAVVFKPQPADQLTDFQVVDAEQVLEASNSAEVLILDARSPGRFRGEEKEFRPGLRSGHIPGSRNVPFTDLLHEGQLKSDAELHALFAQAGLSDEAQVITSCGSGVTAAVICLALERIGVKHVALYDGSWSEWGGLHRMPVESVQD